MMEKLRDWLGLNPLTERERDHLLKANMRAATYMTAIVIALETWMIFSLGRYLVESGKPRSFQWIVEHGGWYVVLLALAIGLLVCALRYLKGKANNPTVYNVFLWVFSFACIAFGVHYGNNSYVQGEQILTFVTMTLFVFGILVWRPVPAFIFTVITFLGFYLYIESNLPTTYGTQVNLLTLWISTFVVALSSYHQHIAEARSEEGLEVANTRLEDANTKLEDANTRLEDVNTNLAEANARLVYMSTHDELTGIPNLHAFHSVAELAIEEAAETGKEISLLYFNVENFKSYNQKYGYMAGDDLLCEIGEGLEKVFIDTIAARVSDDHFAALCYPEDAERLVEESCAMVRALRGEIRLHMRCGSYQTADNSLSVDLCLDRARIAARTIRKQPGRHLAIFDEKLAKQRELRQHVINNIKRAVDEGWIRVFYQPVVDCAGGTRKLVGREALARWDDPEYGLLPPYAFIEALEEYRDIDKLDRCIIEQVCRDLREDLDAGVPVVPVSLNFSRLDFELYDVPAFLKQTAARYDIPSNLLDVEITESALTDTMHILQQNMAELREGKFSLWLDDFGSGYSSLNVLKDFRFNVLKIDMVFLRGYPENKRTEPILTSIVRLAKDLDMITLCEGVETEEQYEFLRSIGCDRAQGYYFGKPAPRE